MRLSYFFFLLVLLCPISGKAGNKYAGQQPAAQQLQQLYDSAIYYKDKLPASSIPFISKGIELAQYAGNDSVKAKFLQLGGLVNYKLNNYTIASEDFHQAIIIRKKLKQYAEIANLLINIGAISERQGDYTKAQKVYLEALGLAERSKNDSNTANALYRLGNLYILMGHYVPAYNYFNKSKGIYNGNKDFTGIGKTCLGLGSVFKLQHNFDSALYYFKLAEKSYQTAGSKTGLSFVYNNIGALYSDYELYKEALVYYNKNLQLYNSLSEREGKALALANLGVCYHDQGNYKQALNYLRQAEKLANELQISYIITEVYYNISSAYEELGDLKPALKYAQMYSDLKDTLFTKESNKQIIEMRQKYEAEKSEQEIKRLQTEKALEESKLTVRTQQRNLIILFTSVIFIVLGLLIYSYRQKLRLKEIKAQQAEEKNRQEINNLLKEQEINAVSAMIQGQEQERQRVAEDLHDRLGSLLSTVKLNFSGLEKKLNTGLTDADQYKKGIYLLDEACSEVRKIAYNMASGVLQKYGFVTAVEELKTSIESSNTIQVHFYKYNIEQPVDKDTEINLYRITQELVSNILKHAGATEIHIQYSIIQDTINLIVEDNGCGFNPVKKAGAKGMGIGNIHARVSKLDGTVDFDSSLGRGTIVIINIPVKNTSLVPTINQPA